MQLVRVVLVLCGLIATWGPAFAVPVLPQIREDEPELVSPPRFVAGQLLIGFAPELDEVARDSLIVAHGGETITRLDRLAARVVSVRPDLPLGEIARGFASAPGVRYAEPNTVQQVSTTPSDPSYGDQWALAKIGAPTAWATTTGDPGDEVVVGVVDSGVDYDHPDLAANMWTIPTGQTIDGVALAHTAIARSAAWRAAILMMTRGGALSLPGRSVRLATTVSALRGSIGTSRSWR